MDDTAHEDPSTSPSLPAASSSSGTSRALRSSARVKAAKDKGKQKEEPQPPPEPRQTRAQASKRKGKQPAEERPAKKSKRANVGIVINEPAADHKGKKRAISPTDDEEESAEPEQKRTKYALRSSATMPKKNAATSPTKAKAAAAAKGKQAAPPPPGPSRLHEQDEHSDEQMERDDELPEHQPSLSMHDDEPDDDEDDEDEPASAAAMAEASRGFAGLDAESAMAIFSDFRQLGSYMVSLSGRLKTMLQNIKPTADPTTRLLTLQELSELLSISTEDTLAGSFPIDDFVRALVRILGGSGRVSEDGDEDGSAEGDEQDEDAALAAALALSSGSQYAGDENLECQVLAARCLANLMEALPGIAQTVSYHGAIPVLCSKLTEISYIDLAEQTLSTLEKISEEVPGHIVREGGLAALLTYLDFFSIAVQRTALQAAANCCRNISSDNFNMISAVWSTIRICLGYSDQRLVEFACLCVIRTIDSYRSSPEHLESLVDGPLIAAVNTLLLPAGGSPLVAQTTFTQLLRALATAARTSAPITVALLEAGIIDTLYQILTGVLPASQSHERAEQGNASGGQGLGGGLADMTVMQNLAHRPKDQVEETLSLISELLPPLPKDGVFDHKSYTEKTLARAVKAKNKAVRHAAREAQLATVNALVGLAPLPPNNPVPASSEANTPPPADADEDGAPPLATSAPAKDAPAERLAVLRSKPAVVERFMGLIVPILVDVYAASVTISVRMKTLTGLLKAISFLEPEGVKQILTNVPIASFASSILSSKDHPSLMISALQLVELLLSKQPVEYKPVFRREGVFHEVEILAQRALIVSKLKDKEKDKDAASSETPSPAPTPSSQLPSTLPGYKKLTQLALDPEDAITLRARVIKFHYLASSREAEDAGSLFGTLQWIVKRLSAPKTNEKDAAGAVNELATLFAKASTSVSSFELLQSGIVEALLGFATDEGRTLPVERRQAILLQAFRGAPGSEGESPLSVFVKKLQESLTRMENFDVVTVSPGSDDGTKRASSPSLLARQLRLRLVADGTDVPRNLSNIVVSIHAIATFQALHDYLRPRVSGLLTGSGARLSGMLAALAAARPSGSMAGSAVASSSALPPLPPALSASSTPPPSAGEAATPSSSTPAPAKSARRRSSRLSAKNALANDTSDEATASTSGDQSTSATEAAPSEPPTTASTAVASEPAASTQGETAASDTVMNDEHEPDLGEFTDDDVDAEVFEEEMGDEDSVVEKTVNLSVADDGSKVEAQTPDGTRVGTPASAAALREPPSTPTPSRPGPSTTASPSKNTSSGSYASALKAKPQDWHLEFSMDEHTLPLDLTIYGAIHQHERRKKAAGTPVTPAHLLWQGVYTVKFKKVPGPAPPEDSDVARARSPTPALPGDAPHTKILELLGLLNKLTTYEAEHGRPVLLDSAFVNNKLTAKLTRQLEEPMIVASQCLPDWALDLPMRFPFLFPFATRYNFVQSTSFGYARLILKWQSAQQRQEGNSNRRDDGVGFLGRLQRQKVRISRKHILESAMKVFELYGSSSSILEVEYFEEVGTGLGPTLEFYSLVSSEFARRDLKVWRDEDTDKPGVHVWHPRGLFPAPISAEELAADGGAKKTHIVKVIGQFVAKALLDSRIIDVSFNKVFLRLALGKPVPRTVEYLKMVDVELAQSLEKLRAMAGEQPAALDKLTGRVEDAVKIEDLALDFTLPGYDIELRPNGRDIAVTAENVEEYITDVIEAIIGEGAMKQARAFREGFSKVFPIEDLQAFTLDELVMLFGNAEEDWSVETLQEALKADHGFNSESRAIHNLVEIMAAYDLPTRRHFLQFITGSPKLPIGGFRGLNPTLTVVRKPSEAPLSADDYLPSVMTCVNYLKLPDYSTREVMTERMRVAMLEGVGSFHLS